MTMMMTLSDYVSLAHDMKDEIEENYPELHAKVIQNLENWKPKLVSPTIETDIYETIITAIVRHSEKISSKEELSFQSDLTLLFPFDSLLEPHGVRYTAAFYEILWILQEKTGFPFMKAIDSIMLHPSPISLFLSCYAHLLGIDEHTHSTYISLRFQEDDEKNDKNKGHKKNRLDLDDFFQKGVDSFD